MKLFEIVITRGYDPYPVAMRYVEATDVGNAYALGTTYCLRGEQVDEVNYVKDVG